MQNKVIVITGGGDGLGLAIAKRLAKSNKLIIVSRDEKKLKVVSSELGCEFRVCDVSDYEAVESMSKSIFAEYGKVDVLVNNAGVWLEGKVEENDPEKISKVINTNVKGVIYMSRVVIPQMRACNAGIIMNVSSAYGLNVHPDASIYIASKFAVRGFTDALKEDLKGTKVRALGFFPGGMKTELFSKAGSQKDVSEWMNVEDVAEVVEFILDRPDTLMMDLVGVNRIK